MTSGGGGASCTATTTRPPDLQDQGGGEEAEEDLNSEACMEMLQEALEEAAGAQVPYKYTPEPGGSQVSRYAHTPLQVPIAGGLVVATFVGGPVIFLAGLKLGMFAAIGGGIMGYATGKMFAEHE